MSALLKSQLDYPNPVHKVRSLPIAAIVLGFALFSACGAPASENGDPRGRFGDPYEVETNTSPAAPDEPPALIADSLSVLVSYPGGCADHHFDLGSSLVGDSATVWIRHDSGGDGCEARISDRIQLDVPESVLGAPNVYLLNPTGDAPYLLRWSDSTP